MSEYVANYFIIPSHIVKLPGITDAFKRIYETFFQFWNKGKDCFLSNDAIKERAGIRSSSTLNDAFKFFEQHGQLQRTWIRGQRYLKRTSLTETSTLDTLLHTNPESRPTERGVSVEREGGLGRARHKIKKLNKEIKNREREGSPSSFLFDQLDQNQLNDTVVPQEPKAEPNRPTLSKTPNIPPLSYKNPTNSSTYTENKRTQKFFDEIWSIYPQKQKLNEARELWAKMNLDDHKDEILDGIQHHIKNNPQWKVLRFVPHLVNFLAGKRWDERIEAKNKSHYEQQGRVGRQRGMTVAEIMDYCATVNTADLRDCREGLPF